MTETYEKELAVTPVNADRSGKLSYHDTFGAFMDMASAHADVLGCGVADIKKRSLFWLVAKTAVRFRRRPEVGEKARLVTWPEKPERIRGCRSYEIIKDGEILVRGKTEWAVMNTETGRLAPMEGIYPAELVSFPESACPEAFTRITVPEERVPLAEYRVRSTDIDVGGHMNNVAYIRMITGCFSSAELERLDPKLVEAVYRAPCFEGDTLLLTKAEDESGMTVFAEKDGKIIFMLRME
ncbi:MAG: hypothetical protein K6G56_05360 [Clostridiales bacterium]|nr:hypothetical protein [Clostridiales bacterium]